MLWEQCGRALKLGSRNTQTGSGMAQLRAEQGSSGKKQPEGHYSHVQHRPCFRTPISMTWQKLQQVGFLKCFMVQACLPSPLEPWRDSEGMNGGGACSRKLAEAWGCLLLCFLLSLESFFSYLEDKISIYFTDVRTLKKWKLPEGTGGGRKHERGKGE